jgi:hypothetical protein
MYALLIGGGMTEEDNIKCFYNSIEYVYHTLKKLGYRKRDIKVLFYGGKTPDRPIVEGDATKDNFLTELRLLGDTIDSNDSLLLFRSGHGIIRLVFEKYQNGDGNPIINNKKSVGAMAVMTFPDDDLSQFEFQDILKKISAKQIIVILNQCFSGQFAQIADHLDNTVVITETRTTEMAIKDSRKTIRWAHDEWPFVKCLFDGFLQNSTTGQKQSVFNAFQFMRRCNPIIEGVPISADRPLLRENPQIKYGKNLKEGNVYLH